MILLLDLFGKGHKIRPCVIISVKRNIPMFIIHKDCGARLFVCFCFLLEESEYIRFLLSYKIGILSPDRYVIYYCNTKILFFQGKYETKRKFMIFLRFKATKTPSKNQGSLIFGKKHQKSCFFIKTVI